MVPSFVEFQQARQGSKAIGQCVSCGMQRKESELGQSPFVYEDIREGRVRTDSSSAPSRATSSETFTLSMALGSVKDARVWGSFAEMASSSQSP
jgi:hypothetical protein